MSNTPYMLPRARWGFRMGDGELVDGMMRDGFMCPMSNLLMGQTAEILAREYGITREESDAFALESQLKAEAAITAGRMKPEIAAAPGKDAKGKPVELETELGALLIPYENIATARLVFEFGQSDSAAGARSSSNRRTKQKQGGSVKRRKSHRSR